MFKRFRKKKTENKLCKCENKSNMDIAIAEKISSSSVLEYCCNKITYSNFTIDDIEFNSMDSFEVKVTTKLGKFKVRISTNRVFFTKRACLSCGTCLGWYIENVKINNTPYDMISASIRDAIESRITKRSRKIDAKKICNIK